MFDDGFPDVVKHGLDLLEAAVNVMHREPD